LDVSMYAGAITTAAYKGIGKKRTGIRPYHGLIDNLSFWPACRSVGAVPVLSNGIEFYLLSPYMRSQPSGYEGGTIGVLPVTLRTIWIGPKS
jgi:hypothetical protein